MKTADEARGLVADAGKRHQLFIEKVRKSEDIEAILEIILKEIEFASSLGKPAISIWYPREMEKWRNLDGKIVDDLTKALNERGFFADIRLGSSWFIAWGTIEEPFDLY